MKLEVHQKKNKQTEKHKRTWRLNNMLQNNEWVNNEIKETSKGTVEQVTMRAQQPQMCGTQQKQSYGERHSITGLSQEPRQVSNK